MEFLKLHFTNGHTPALYAQLPATDAVTTPDGKIHHVRQLGRHNPEARLTLEELKALDPELEAEFAAMLPKLYEAFRKHAAGVPSDPDAVHKLASENARNLQRIQDESAAVEAAKRAAEEEAIVHAAKAEQAKRAREEHEQAIKDAAAKLAELDEQLAAKKAQASAAVDAEKGA